MKYFNASYLLTHLNLPAEAKPLNESLQASRPILKPGLVEALTSAYASLICAFSVLVRSRWPNFALIMLNVVSTFDRLW